MNNGQPNANAERMKRAIQVQSHLIARINQSLSRRGVQESMDQTAMRFIVQLAAKFRAEYQAGRFDKYRVS